MKRMKNANLRPLQPDIHRTARWNFRGKNLSKRELAALRTKGVTDEDWMPDGRLKLPQYRRKFKDEQKFGGFSLKHVNKLVSKWTEEYKTVPQPKPHIIAWFLKEHGPVLFKVLIQGLLMSGKYTTALGYAKLFMEYGTSKPAQTVEHVQSQAEVAQLTPVQLAEMALEMAGFDPVAFREFAKQEPAKPIQIIEIPENFETDT